VSEVKITAIEAVEKVCYGPEKSEEEHPDCEYMHCNITDT
jgi:hypothetical protein